MSDHHPTPHLLLIDISGFIRRAYHSGSNRFRSDGLPTWAIEGTMALLWRLLGAAQHDQPTLAAACFDAPGKTFRSDLYPEYKSNRPARDEELKAQIPYVYHAVETMGIARLEAPGFEADDILCTMAARAAIRGIRVTIVSSDKDMEQCVGPLVQIVNPTAHARITEQDVRRGKFGVSPAQVPDVQALAGDSVDNIPGLDGIGMKSATRMVSVFGSIEGCVAAVRDPDKAYFIQPRQRAELKRPQALDRLRLYRTLATLRCDVPIEAPLESLTLKPIMRDHVDKMLKVLEASGRFEAIFATAPQMQRVVEKCSVFAAYDWWEEELKAPGQVVPDLPQCGYYERRITPKGLFVPACIWREDELDPITGAQTGQQILRCHVGNAPMDPILEWAKLGKHPITKEKYSFEIADRAWLAAHDPAHPKNRPHSPVDRTALPAVHCSQPDRKRRKTK